MNEYSPHVDRRYEAAIHNLVDQLLEMGTLVEAMCTKGVDALLTGDAVKAAEVVAADDAVDALEVKTDVAAMQLLSRHAPVGADLRLATCAFKVVTDFERVGDIAVSIARTTTEVAQPIDPGLRDDIAALAERAIAVLAKAVDALRQRRAVQAGALVLEDPLVDQLNFDAFKRLKALAEDRPDLFKDLLALSAVCRHLERIGDHAVNIGEMVVYYLDGRVLRHAPVEDRLG